MKTLWNWLQDWSYDSSPSGPNPSQHLRTIRIPARQNEHQPAQTRCQQRECAFYKTFDILPGPLFCVYLWNNKRLLSVFKVTRWWSCLDRLFKGILRLKAFRFKSDVKYFGLSVSSWAIIANGSKFSRTPSLAPRNNFTVVCSVPWPLNRSEVGSDLVLLQTFLFFIICKWSCSRAC